MRSRFPDVGVLSACQIFDPQNLPGTLTDLSSYGNTQLEVLLKQQLILLCGGIVSRVERTAESRGICTVNRGKHTRTPRGIPANYRRIPLRQQ